MFKKLIHLDALSVTRKLKNNSIQMVYIDPPYNTQKRQQIASTGTGYLDKYEDYIGFLKPICQEFKRVLKDDGVLCVHLDHREVHYAKVMLDSVFGRDRFLGEIIWHSELGASSRKFWAMKHTTMLLYSKSEPKFNQEKVPVVSKSPPSAGDKRLTSVWYYTLSNTARERVDYPNQKPEYLLENLINVHTDSGDIVLDTFAGSGTTASVAKRLNRGFVTCDVNEQSIVVCEKRLSISRSVIE